MVSERRGALEKAVIYPFFGAPVEQKTRGGPNFTFVVFSPGLNSGCITDITEGKAGWGD